MPTPVYSLRLLTVLVGMGLRRFIGMHARLTLVARSGVSMVGGLLVLASLMLFSGLIVMLGGFAAMHRCLLMMLGCFLGHWGFPWSNARPFGPIFQQGGCGFVPMSVKVTQRCEDRTRSAEEVRFGREKKSPEGTGLRRTQIQSSYSLLDFIPFDDELLSLVEALGWPVAAADPGGAELCSFAPVDVSPLAPSEDLFEAVSAASEPGGAELCSFAPVDVSPPAG